MIQSIAVYGFMILNFFFLGISAGKKQRLKPKTKYWTGEIILILFIFALFCGLRNNVGVDYSHYLNDYLHPNAFDRAYSEWLYAKLVDTMSMAGIHYAFYFALIAFLQLFFTLQAFKNERYLYPYLLFVLMTNGTYFMWMNGMRQCLVICMFLFSIQFIRKREFLKFMAIIIPAFFIHKSVVIVLPLYFSFFSKDIFKSKILQLSILAGAVFLCEIPFWNNYIGQIEIIGNFFNLGSDTMSIEDRLMIYEGIHYSKGLRFYATIVIGIICILYSDKVKQLFNTNLLYNIFYFGLLTATLFYNSNILQRPCMYFIYLQYVTIAYTLYYLKNNIKKGIFYGLSYWSIIVILLLYLLVSILANTYTQYYFIWQVAGKMAVMPL